MGILHILDDESSFPKATDQSFLEKCHYNHGTNALYQRPKQFAHSFSVVHYAGDVSYTVTGFLDKNRDTLRADVIELFIGSGLTILSKMFQEWKDSSDFVKTIKRGAGRFVTMKPRTPTVSARFQESLSLLVETMSKCHPHFIRCIKPNNNKVPFVFESKLVLDQLKYTGMLETIRIRKVGYPVRVKFNHFLDQYACLLKSGRVPAGTSPKAACQSVIDSFYERRNERPDTWFKSKVLPDYQLGNSKVFLRESLHRKIEFERHKVLEEAAIVIQRNIRGYLRRKFHREQQEAALTIQKNYRGYSQRKEYQKLKEDKARGKKRHIEVHPPSTPHAEHHDTGEKTHRPDGRRTEQSLSAVKHGTGLPEELLNILAKLSDWHAPHAERNIGVVVGHVEPSKGQQQLELPRDIDTYVFSKYAAQHCKDKAWSTHQNQIHHAFLARLTEVEQQESLSIFHVIREYAERKHSTEKKDVVLVDYIVYKGLANHTLRDEIYCQLYNQTRPSSVPDSGAEAVVTERAWFLLACCLSAFSPSKTLYPFLLKYVTDHAPDNLKFTCQTKLLQSRHSDVARSYPPTMLEARGIRQNGMPAMPSTLPNGSKQVAPVTSWTTASQFASDILQQRNVEVDCAGWTVMMIRDENDSLVELNGSDYILDLIAEYELPPAFPFIKHPYLTHHMRKPRRKQHSAPTGKHDFDGDDDFEPSSAPHTAQDSRIARLGLAKNSKLNHRYESERKDLAKGSALNKRYILTEADVAIAVGADSNKSAKEHPGLSPSALNCRYRAGTSPDASVESDVSVQSDSLLSPSKHDKRHQYHPETHYSHSRGAHSVMSDAHSLSSHVQRIRMPSASNPKEINDYLDEIFDPVTLGYDDEEHQLVRPDVKALAASIKGGGARAGQDPGPEFRRPTANASAQSAGYPYGAVVPPMMPQFGLPQLPPTMGYYPPIGPVADPVLQHYLQQQSLANQMHLQHQLSAALQQNLELQHRLIQSQQEMVAANHRGHPVGSDGNSAGGSPDSLPQTPSGHEDIFMMKERSRNGGTPLPTTGVGKVGDEQPPLPPRKYTVPPKNHGTINIPPPPPPPPPAKPVFLANNKNRAQIPGRAKTIKIANIRWPPKVETPPVEEPLEPPRRFIVTETAVEDVEPRAAEPLTPSKLRLDPKARDQFERTVGGQSVGQKSKTEDGAKPSKQPVVTPHSFVRPDHKPTLDAKGIPVPPPPPTVAHGASRPKLPPRQDPIKHTADVHAQPKVSAEHKESRLGVPSSSHYSYSRTQWSMTLRKEFFTPAEKIDSPYVTDLIFAQIYNDVFNESCVRMTLQEKQKMQSLFEKHGLKNTESGFTPSQASATTKKTVIEAAKELPLYFCRLYPVSNEKNDNETSRRLFLGMSHTGLRLIRLEKNNDDLDVLLVDEHRRFDEVVEVTTAQNSELKISFNHISSGPGTKDLDWRFYSQKAVQIKVLIDQMIGEADQLSGMELTGDFVRAVSDYRTSDPTLLSFRKGDVIKLGIRNQSYLDKGWLYGNIGDRWGIFPCEHVVALTRPEILQLRKNLVKNSRDESRSNMPPGTHAVASSTSSSSSSQKSNSSDGVKGGAPSKTVSDGRMSMVEFAMFNFRQSIEKYGIRTDHKPASGSSMQGSIKQLEKLKDVNGKEWTWKEQAEMVKFSKSPIRLPLLKHDNPELDRNAVESFYWLMRFMGDYPMQSTQNEVDCVYMVLKVCHRYPTLRDEIYCQIIKQTTNNKSVKPDSCQLGWRFLSIIAAYFDCSEVLRPYLFKYLETAAYDKRRPYHGTALVCLQNLRKTLKYGGRKNVPSVDEVTAIAAGRSSKRQLYLLPGGIEKILNTKSTTVAEDVIMELCTQLKIDSASEMDEYSIYALRDKDDMQGVPLQYEDYILDITTDLLVQGSSYMLLFRRSVWYFPLRTENHLNETYIEMMFHQAVPDYLDGLLLVSPPGGLLDEEIKEVSKLAALLHRSTDAVQPPDVKEAKYLLPKPALVLPEPKPSHWLRIVQEYFQATVELTPIEAKAEFLNKLQRWTLFGSSFFFVTRMLIPVSETGPSTSRKNPAGESKRPDGTLMEHILAVNKNGVFFLDVETRETVVHFPFSDILSTRRIKSNTDGALYLDMKCGTLLAQRITRIQTAQVRGLFIFLPANPI
ncbi:hypothetical protein RvY_04984-2 [Ramazzottius varieornatus]|uniref:Unconventional myosin-XV n=1 Tax=Ramazzottius varieornatus TaxID=947166 RepID=A0A1D1V059_RAMVA|nr:hypothetical protein RvY_04984-2 [Ramazzottius varieornatus]